MQKDAAYLIDLFNHFIYLKINLMNYFQRLFFPLNLDFNYFSLYYKENLKLEDEIYKIR